MIYTAEIEDKNRHERKITESNYWRLFIVIFEQHCTEKST